MYEIVVGRNDIERKELGLKGSVFLGKHYVQMGSVVSLSNKVYMDVARSHVVFIVGKRGSGKCIHGDTLITLDDGSLVPIKNLENNERNILSLNHNLKIKSTQKSEFFSRNVDRLLYIKLRSGKSIKLTQEHPLLTVKGWVPVQDLKVGSRIATPRVMDCFGSYNMLDHEVKLLAYLIAEGHTKKIVIFSNTDKDIINDFKDSLYSFDSNLELVEERFGSYRISMPFWRNEVLEVNVARDKMGKFISSEDKNIYKKRSIRQLIEREELFGLLSKEKYLSQNILRLNKSKLALFLNRLFSCDGSIYSSNNTWEISYASSSRKLIDQIHHLLLRFGILSRIRTKKIKFNGNCFDSYEIVIGSSNVVTFINQIGFFGEKSLKQKIALVELSKKSWNPNTDIIPKEIWNVTQPKDWTNIGRALGYKYPKAMRETLRYSPSRQKLLQIANVEQNEILLSLSTSDVFWDEIVSIELLEGDFMVYDLSVPVNHNFIANDIIIHNSYSLGVIAEEMCNLPEEVSNKLAILIFDTMGIYWTMKYENEKDDDLLREWGLRKKALDVDIYTPAGYYEQYKEEGMPANFKFTINPSEIEVNDWCMAFDVGLMSQEGILIENVVGNLKKRGDFSLEDVVVDLEQVKDVDENVRKAVINRFKAAISWGLFDIKGTKLKDILRGGRASVLDISCYNNWTVKTLVVGLICRKLMLERMAARKKEELVDVERGYSRFSNPLELAEQMPIVWLLIDECLPYNAEIITSKNHTAIGDIINDFEKGENIDVWAYNTEIKQYGYYPVQAVYRKGKRSLIKIITETGRDLICTPNHRILTKNGFIHSNLANNVGVPAVYHHDQNLNSVKARLLGCIFGDSWLSNNRSVEFSRKGCEDDLLKIKDDLFVLNLSSGLIHSRDTKSKICDSDGKIVEVNGLSQSICYSRKAFNFFKDLGAPVGIKVINVVKIPEWIINGDNKVKSEFLAALFASDRTSPSLAKKIYSDYNPIELSFNKSELFIKEAYFYANQITSLLDSLTIKSKISQRKGNIRKDGVRTIKIVITIDKQLDNMILFLSKVGYRYCKRKEIEGKKWLSYLMFRNKWKQDRIELKRKALNLYDIRGLRRIKITRILDIKDYEVYYSKNVCFSKIIMSFDDWIKTRYKNETIFEQIIDKQNAGEEEVYDLAVENVHNFVSNDIVVHNCHEFLPKEGKTLASDALIQVLREGRQPGVSLIAASQQPGMIHNDMITQTDIVIAHRLTAKRDIAALNAMMQSYTGADIRKYLNALPNLKGSALILDDNSERLYPIRVRPRLSWHGGEAPRAVRPEKNI